MISLMRRLAHGIPAVATSCDLALTAQAHGGTTRIMLDIAILLLIAGIWPVLGGAQRQMRLADQPTGG